MSENEHLSSSKKSIYCKNIDSTKYCSGKFEGLKDFQIATVKRILNQFKKQNRILVADEVGLGKTLVAKGVIAGLVEEHKLTQSNPFKIVYICTNQNLSKQNARKLSNDYFSVTRLSLLAFESTIEDNNEKKEKIDKSVELISITPDTSINLSNRTGNVDERVLMCLVLSEVMEIDLGLDNVDNKNFIRLFQGKVGFESFYKRLGEYKLKTEKVENFFKKKLNNIERENGLLSKIRDLVYNKPNEIDKNAKEIIGELRKIFATLGLEQLNPNLLILDEFQRFPQLISGNNTEISLIKEKLFEKNCKTLLLSATPYKPYTTLAEIDFKNEEHYKEFLNVVSFLFNDKQRFDEFKEEWNKYTSVLDSPQNFYKDEFSESYKLKKNAEAFLYEVVCRTERCSFLNDTKDHLDTSNAKPINISIYDIKSYKEVSSIIRKLTGLNVPIDYVKSCPYLISYLTGYKLKDKIDEKIKKYNNNIKQAIGAGQHSYSFLKKREIDGYSLNDKQIKPGKYHEANARYSALKCILNKSKQKDFDPDISLLLWVPPTFPYYHPNGVFEGKSHFTKTLIFSSWDMVPKMISTLLSYDVEESVLKNKGKKYTLTKIGHLRIRKKGNQTEGLSTFTILYPSISLSELYNPRKSFDLNKSIESLFEELENEIKKHIAFLIKVLSCKYPDEESFFIDDKKNPSREQEQWYYLAPMLIDWFLYDKAKNKKEDFERCYKDSYLGVWIEELKKLSNKKKETKHVDLSLVEGIKAIEALLSKVEKKEKLPKIPNDLCDVLFLEMLGSPSVCYLRAQQNNSFSPATATLVAEALRKRFNSHESTAVIEKAIPNNNHYWRKVLQYCVDGNLQSMLDEYIYLQFQASGAASVSVNQDYIDNSVLEGFSSTLAHYRVALYNNNKIEPIRMRTHYAACFAVGDGDEKDAKRNEHLRNAFNSPLWPFVLSSTSIGQEGLDFHYYCRRVVHWNLPSNPIDIEQREGRVNRYMNLSVRQSISEFLSRELFSIVDSLDDACWAPLSFWDALFETAKSKISHFSDLIPYWCLGKEQCVKIERVVLMYPYSKDIEKYNQFLKIISFYRLMLGQPRQEELITHLFNEFGNDICIKDHIKKWLINLSPLSKKEENQERN